MKFHLKINSLISILLVLVYLPSIKSDCIIEYPSDISTIPKYEKYIGKFKIKIPHNGNPLKLYNGENVHGFCDTYFSDISYQITSNTYDYGYRRYTEDKINKVISNYTTIIFKCSDNKLLINDIQDITQKKFSCGPKNLAIYTTKKPYSWCEKNQNSTTFLMTSKSITNNYVVAAICYNMNQTSLQTVVYNSSIMQQNYWDMPQHVRKTKMISNKDLEEDLWNFKTSTLTDLSEELLQETLTKLRNTDELLNFANYEVSSIVQDEPLKKYLNNFKNIFNIIWWRNLRLGNWKRFLNTLENYGHNNFHSYELYTGTSGVAQYPTNDNCIKEKLLEMKIGFKNETVPAYIWTYLKSHDKINKDFIIVGYNSPYAEYFGIDKVKFCPDICSEIPWLKEIYPSFSYNYIGLMFCCSTDFIRQTNYLEGFPMEILLAQHKQPYVETNTLESLTTL